MAPFAECPVCGHAAADRLHGYHCCPACKHQWKPFVPSVEIENEVLDPRRVTKRDGLTDAKLRVLCRLTTSRKSLLDFGAGSGKYAYFCRQLFKHVEGIEVTPSCIAFARDTLGIVLRPEFVLGARYDVITAWHSLEHLPPESLRDIVRRIHDATNEAFILSVPNSSSWASRWFGMKYPYHDPESHFQQFSPASLRRLLEDSGWLRITPFRVAIYSVFCYAQGFTNWVTGTHNLLYFRLKRGRTQASLTPVGLGLHAMLFLMFLPVACILTAAERFAPERGACLHMACYKNDPRHIHPT